MTGFPAGDHGAAQHMILIWVRTTTRISRCRSAHDLDLGQDHYEEYTDLSGNKLESINAWHLGLARTVHTDIRRI